MQTNDYKLRMVVADDEPHMRVYLRSLAKSISAKIVGEASNGEEAVRLFRENRPDVLLLDLNMPVKSGEEAMGEILAEFPDAKIIVLSAVADREIVGKCCDIGAVNFILKDCPFTEMVNIVKETVEETSRGAVDHGHKVKPKSHAKGDRARRVRRKGRA